MGRQYTAKDRSKGIANQLMTIVFPSDL